MHTGSDCQPLEYFLRQGFDDQHDIAPVPGQIDYLFALLDSAVDALANYARAGEKRPLFERRRHWRIHQPRLDGHNGDARLVQATAQALQKEADSPFRRAIHVIAAPPAITCHRSYHGNAAVAQLLKIVPQDRQQRDDTGAVGGELLQRLLDALLALLLVAQCAMRDQHGIQPIQCGNGMLDQFLMPCQVVEVELADLHALCPAHSQVLRDSIQLLRRAPSQKKLRTLARETLRSLMPDG